MVGFSQTYLMTIVFLVLMGIAGGGYHPSAAPLISASVEPKNQGRALGFHLVGGSGSFFLAPLIAAAIASSWGWRGSFIVLAVPTAIFGIAFYFLLGRVTAPTGFQSTTPSIGDIEPSPPGRLRRLVAFMVLSILTQAVAFSVVTFIPLYMVDSFGVAEETAAAFMAIVYSAGLWASPLGGYLSDRLGRIPVILVVCLAAGPAIYLLNLVPYGIAFGALLLVLGMLMYIRMPVSEVYILGHTPERHRSAILGIYYFSSMETGGVFAPIMGSFIDQFGFFFSFAIAAIATVVITVVCSVFLWGNWE